MENNNLMEFSTSYAHIIKNLTEVLQTNLQNTCFVFNKQGIYLKAMDVNKII